MTTEAEEKDLGAWELESGLISDVDAWIANPHFGYKEEYRSKVMETGASESGLMFLVDLVDDNGAVLASQGFSVGTGFIPSDDGLSISHPKRNNVVRGCRYADLQERVVKVLGIDMMSKGSPLDAGCWDGLGFHWMLEDHTTVSGDTKQGIMPTLFISDKKGQMPAPAPGAVPGAVPPTQSTPPGAASEADALLAVLIPNSPDIKAFQMAAMKIPAVTQNDALMASVFDEGP